MMADVVSVDSIAGQASEDSPWIADKGWVIVQKKTFTNWVNSHLLKGNQPGIIDVTEDLVNGVALLRLLEIIGGVSLGRYNYNPKLRIQKVENVNKALSFIHSRGVNLTNIGAEDIVDGNQKLILGLVWMIILKFSISYISEEGYEAKDALLLWCQRQTGGSYDEDFKITDFTYSWKSGLGFCALIHKNHPELLDYHSLDKAAARQNTELAFNVAEEKLKIPKLFEATDITEVEKPDERSVVTYLAQFFHSFTAEERRKNAAQKIAKFAHDMKACYHLKDDYEERFAKLKSNIIEKKDMWCGVVIESLTEAEKVISDLRNFRSGQKNEWAAERKKLWMLLGIIHIKRSTYELEPYTPPIGYLPKDMSLIWNDFINQEKILHDMCLDFIISYRGVLRMKFSSLLGSLTTAIEDIASCIGSIHRDSQNLEDQLDAANGYLTKIEHMYEDASLLEQCETECEVARVYDNGELAPGTSKVIKYELNTLVDLANERISIIKSQIEARKISDLDSGRLMELTETFHYMDKNKDGYLNKDELFLALKAEGLDVDENMCNNLYKNTFGGKDVTYEEFIEYMKREGAVLSHDQIMGLFKTVSSDGKYVSHNSLLGCGISKAAVDDICRVIPTNEDGVLDYETFLVNNLTKGLTLSNSVNEA